MNVVFAIGCRRYSDPDVAQLKYADRDAKRFVEAVTGTQDPDNTETYLLHDDHEIEGFIPTRSNILRFLSRGEHRDKSNELDFLFFYFSGHGWSSQDGTDYLLTSDSVVSMPEYTAISVPMLERHLRAWEAKHAMLFIDACRTVVTGGKGSITIAEESRIDVDSLCPPGMVTFCSCEPGQTSYEADPIHSGVFTEGVRRALSNEGRCCTIQELDAYLNDTVPRISDKYGLPRQMPYSRLEPLAVQKALIVSQRTLEEWQTQKLNELYALAHRSHQDQKWQAVIDVFEQIHAEDPTYRDQEGLLTSARRALALEIAQKKEGALRQYREGVESACADGELDRREVETLRDLADKLEMSPSNSAKIEREVMGATKEAILENQEQAAKGRYRRAVGEAWTDNKLSKAEAEELGTLASELGLSMDTATHIEREVMGDTAQAILQRQISEEEEHQRHLEELYAQARRLHGDQEWEAVVDKFEQLHELEPTYPDPEELLESAREALESGRRVAKAYDRGRRHMDAGEWQQALERLEEVQRLAPGYREAKELLSRVEQKLARPPKVKVPDLSGQEISQASRVLTDAGLNLGAQNKVANNTIPEERIIEQIPQAGTEVEAGSVVSIAVSSGPQRVSRRAPPDLLAELAGSWWAMALRGLVIGSFGLAGLVLSGGDFHFRFSYALMIIADGVIARLNATTRGDRRRWLLIQGRISIIVGLFVLGLFVLFAWLVDHFSQLGLPDLSRPFDELAVALRLIGSWAIFIGIFRIIAALQLRWDTKDLWLMGTSGVLLAAFGIALWLRVSPSHDTWWLLQFLLLVSGISLIAVALRLRDQYEWDSRVRQRRV